MGLRVDLMAARLQLLDALRADRIPDLGPAPNRFGGSGQILGFAEELLRWQTDRYRITQATPLGWVSNVTGTGERVHLASRDVSFVSTPWGTHTWVWPNDAVVTINGTTASIDQSKVEELGWSQLGQQLTVSFDVTAPIAQHPSDVVTVSIPDADWLVDYLDGSKHVRMDHRDGPTYYSYGLSADQWTAVEPVPLVDADILYDRPPDAPMRAWVTLAETQATIDQTYFTGKPSGYSADSSISVLIGSGPGHASPRESDTVAYRLLDQVIDVVAALPRLPETGRFAPSEMSTDQCWQDTDDRETILDLTVTLQSR